MQRILKPQMNADERRCIEVNARTVSTIEPILWISFKSVTRALGRMQTLDPLPSLGTSAFICVHLRLELL